MAAIFRDRGSCYDWFVTAMAVPAQSPDLKREGKVKKSVGDIAKDGEERYNIRRRARREVRCASRDYRRLLRLKK